MPDPRTCLDTVVLFNGSLGPRRAIWTDLSVDIEFPRQLEGSTVDRPLQAGTNPQPVSRSQAYRVIR
jgi:hypothetical protein